MPATAWLSISVTARVSKLLAGFAKATAAVKAFAARVVRMAAAVRSAALTFGLLGAAAYMALKKTLGAGEMFNRKMRRSMAIMTGVTVELWQKMEKAAIESASKTMFTTQETAEAFFYLASAGLDAQRSLEALPTVAQFAQAGMFNMARATELLTDAQSALGLTVKNNSSQNMRNMLRVSDVLVKANSIANATTEQFSEALTSRAASAMKMWKISIEEGVAALAAFADQGTKAAEAGTAYDIVIRDLTRSGVRAAVQAERYGNTIYKQSGKFTNLAHIVADLEDIMWNMSDRRKKIMLMDMTFQERSIAHMLKLIGTSRNIVMYQARLESAGGATKRIADMQLTPLEKALAKLQARWTELSKAMQPFTTLAALAAEKFAGWVQGKANSAGVQGIIGYIKTTFNWLDTKWANLKTGFWSFVSTVQEGLGALFGTLTYGLEQLLGLLDRLIPAKTKTIGGFLTGSLLHMAGFSPKAAESVKTAAPAALTTMQNLTQGFKDAAEDSKGYMNAVTNKMATATAGGTLLGDFFSGAMQAPAELLGRQIAEGIIVNLKDKAAQIWALMKFEWERGPTAAVTKWGVFLAKDFMAALSNLEPLYLLTSAKAVLSTPRGLPAAAGGGGGGVQHQEISLSRHAIAGLNVDTTGKRVTDQKLDNIFNELKIQTAIAKAGAIGLTGP